jgi:hypothetical protein
MNGFRLPEWTTDPFVISLILPTSRPGASEKYIPGLFGAHTTTAGKHLIGVCDSITHMVLNPVD